MGAILGFSGTPESQWRERMSVALTHRGQLGEWTDTHESGTMVYRAAAEESLRKEHVCGLHAEDDKAIVLAGRLLGDEQPSSLTKLLAEYRDRGTEMFKQLQGTFVLAIRDGKTMHVVRDGAGARTVSYASHQGRFLFAVEPKSILAVPGFPRRLRMASIAQYLTFSFVPGERTMLEDVFELPAGHCVTFEPGKPLRLTRWFIPEQAAYDGRRESETVADPQVWVDRFRTLLETAVAERMPRDEVPTVFLSGGLDSSVVTAEVSRQNSRPVRTFALHFGSEYPNELEYAAAVAQRCGTEHHEIEIRPRQFLPRLRQMIWHLDDPIGDPITMPNYELASRVAETTRWGFNGEGGDPLFGGPKNIPMLLHHWYGGIPREANFREQRYLASYRRGFEEIRYLLSPDVLSQLDEEADLDGVLTPFFRTDLPRSFLDKLCMINIRLKGAHLILPKVERMMGASGIVPLSPLFDDRIVEFSLRMPPALKLHNGIEKVVLKRSYSNDLPSEVIDRPKSGMRVPVHYWFRGELRRYARKILSARAVRSAGIFNPDRVKQLLSYDIEEGPGRYGLRLWMLVTFEIWRRIVVERESV